jgi:UDP-N-acetylmuramoyl-tripeptide--D-alanyl-D-alanine ligase
MVDFTLGQAAIACGGKFTGNEELLREKLAGIVIDSREVQPGFLFVPIKGEKYDGHDFIVSAFNAGAVCCVSEKPLENGMPYIYVKSSLEAFQNIAEAYHALFSAPVIGVTGSAGKTTTKDMIACVLSRKYKTLKTGGNLNNQRRSADDTKTGFQP